MQEAVCQQKVIKALVFDLGRVLIDFDHMIAARKIARSPGVPAEQIYQFFFDSPLTGLFEEGAISAHDFFHEVKVQLDLNLEFEEFIAIWNDIFFLSDSNRAVYQLVVSLRDRYTLAMLSNVNVLHLSYLKQRYALFDAFHHIFASCEMGMRKPDPRIYEAVLERLAVSPGEVFYTDDRPELIKCAQALGIKGFVFTDIQQLIDDLASHDIRLLQR